MSEALPRPWCFGDPKQHMPTHPDCRACESLQVCGIIARAKNKTTENRDFRTNRPAPPAPPRTGRSGRDTRSPSPPNPEDYVERSDARVGFFSALLFNGAMSAIRAAFVEATFASDQIPRFQYPDPFRDAFKQRREEEEEEE